MVFRKKKKVSSYHWFCQEQLVITIWFLVYWYSLRNSLCLVVCVVKSAVEVIHLTRLPWQEADSSFCLSCEKRVFPQMI